MKSERSAGIIDQCKPNSLTNYLMRNPARHERVLRNRFRDHVRDHDAYDHRPKCQRIRELTSLHLPLVAYTGNNTVHAAAHRVVRTRCPARTDDTSRTSQG